jgi:TonB family protein
MVSKYFLCYLFLIIIILISGCSSSKPSYIPTSNIPVRYTVAELQTLADNGIYPMEILVDSMPVPITRKNPEYPDDARRAGIEGTVWLRVLIGKDGVPKETKLLKSDGEKVVFSKPAIDAAMEWRFTPAIVNNEPVACWIMIPFRFKVDTKK